ncbi:MAG: ABC transporter permease [Ruminococcus sp.]|nr:ABC transporter permease [Ruminococcus sp.]
MYIFKNALRCISRSVGRNVLIGIIVLVIAVSCCIGLSIRQASENAREETMSGLSVTATISYDRQALMEEMGGMNRGESENGEPPEKPEGGFDRDSFKNMMSDMETLSIEEYETYADASTVKDFYYTSTSCFNGSDSFLAVSSSSTDDTSSTEEATENVADNQNNGMMGMQGSMQGGMGDFGGRGNMSMNMGDFTVVGYSSDSAMTDFVSGVASIVEGAVFEEGTNETQCIISQELATFNELSVGDEITVSNPNNEDETYIFSIVGVYEKASSQGDMSSQFGFTMSDPANEIYMSYNALEMLTEKSEEVNTDDTYLALRSSFEATYCFADVEDYETFTEEVYELGLDENYIVTSSDVTAFENSLVPLETLSTTATYFLFVILIIGAVILVVLNIFNVRERKYEIGVLTAMGMKKGKVALQFVTEIFVVTLCAVIIGVAVGGATAVPVTNALLENQNTAQTQQTAQLEQNFGRENNMGGMGMQTPPDMKDNDTMMSQKGRFMDRMPGAQAVSDYVTEINSAMNFTVMLQMLLIAIGLTLVSGVVSALFVMRYEPLRILSDRD